MELILNDFGQYLGTKGQNFVLYEQKKAVKEVPFYKLNQIVLGSGNCVSTSALFWASMFGIEIMVVSKTGKPLSLMMPLSTDKRVKTRLKQYEAYQNHKGSIIAKAILKARISSQISLLEKYCLDSSRLNVKIEKIDIENTTIDQIRSRLTGVEGKCTEQYFKEYWKLFPKCLKPKKREKYKAQSPLNNLLNLGYEILKGEVYKAVLEAHLDPYLGYLHSIQFAKPSLVCDVQEIFRILIEEFLVTYHQKLEPESFEQKGKRSFLKPKQKLKLILQINHLFKKRIPYKRRNYSKKTTIRTIIKEEPIKLAQYLRGNKSFYEPLESKRFSNTMC